ncbi:uncharacterized protein AB675_5355 [Cyphellophora attinorum]|uniref:Uncharacterized protein n=1 Tax=Cyphellophora attinorum TaxID=1664694 RepID=A0A0N0NNR6_9EURO|nr:uncharacterized protein AB675_5355 [Phialophora attinorum]KPI41858.1 hypothetical protein AB675_5355 [Phialophora attinorum]
MSRPTMSTNAAEQSCAPLSSRYSPTVSPLPPAELSFSSPNLHLQGSICSRTANTHMCTHLSKLNPTDTSHLGSLRPLRSVEEMAHPHKRLRTGIDQSTPVLQFTDPRSPARPSAAGIVSDSQPSDSHAEERRKRTEPVPVTQPIAGSQLKRSNGFRKPSPQLRIANPDPETPPETPVLAPRRPFSFVPSISIGPPSPPPSPTKPSFARQRLSLNSSPKLLIPNIRTSPRHSLERQSTIEFLRRDPGPSMIYGIDKLEHTERYKALINIALDGRIEYDVFEEEVDALIYKDIPKTDGGFAAQTTSPEERSRLDRYSDTDRVRFQAGWQEWKRQKQILADRQALDLERYGSERERELIQKGEKEAKKAETRTNNTIALNRCRKWIGLKPRDYKGKAPVRDSSPPSTLEPPVDDSISEAPITDSTATPEDNNAATPGENVPTKPDENETATLEESKSAIIPDEVLRLAMVNTACPDLVVVKGHRSSSATFDIASDVDERHSSAAARREVSAPAELAIRNSGHIFTGCQNLQPTSDAEHTVFSDGSAVPTSATPHCRPRIGAHGLAEGGSGGSGNEGTWVNVGEVDAVSVFASSEEEEAAGDQNRPSLTQAKKRPSWIRRKWQAYRDRREKRRSS